MSDNDDFLNDDLIGTGDDTYNIDIEDEDLLLADDDDFKTTPDIKKIITPDLKQAAAETPTVKTSPVVNKISIVRTKNIPKVEPGKKRAVTKTPVVKKPIVSKTSDVIKQEIPQKNAAETKAPVVIQKAIEPKQNKPVETKAPVVVQKANLQQNKPIQTKAPVIVRQVNLQQNKPVETKAPVVVQQPIETKVPVVQKPIEAKAPVIVQKPTETKTSVTVQQVNLHQNKPSETKSPTSVQKLIETKSPVQQNKPVITKTPIVIRPEQLLPKETPTPIVNKTPIVIRSDQLRPKESPPLNISPVKNDVQPNKPIVISPKQINLNQSKEISSNTVQEAPSSEISTDQISSTEKNADLIDGIDDNDRVSSSIDVEKPKYRDDQNERFPSERQNDSKTNDVIPDSLDNVLVDDREKFEGKQFGNRRNFHNDNRSPQKGFRGRRDFGGSRPPFREEGRSFREDGGNFDRGPNFYPPRFNERSDFGPRNDFRSMPPGNRFDSDSLKFTISNPPPPLFMGPRGPNDLPPKKVLINPHFKGPGYSGQDFSRSQFLDDRLHSFPPPRIDSFSGRRLLDLAQGPVSEEALGKLAEQFINEQQRCLQYKMTNNDDDFFEKTKRFIENTSIEKPPERKDPELELLRQKQEQFIKSNINNLYKRRDPLPPSRTLRSPPKRPRPAKSFRSRSPSPSQKTTEPTTGEDEAVEGEDGEYKAKMKEQAQMRARILQAKERRRKRDAETLKQKLDELLEKEEEDEKRLQAQRRNETNTGTFNQDNNSNSKESGPKAEDDILMHMDEFLDDDALLLSPEAEDLLLTDPEDDIATEKRTVKHKVPKITILGSSKGQPAQATVKPKPIVFNSSKNEVKKPVSSQTEKPNLKRSAENKKQDLRAKISKPMEVVVPTQAVQPRKKIVYGEANYEKDSTKSIIENKDSSVTSLTQKMRDNKNTGRVPTIAARVISDVLQTVSNVNNKRTVLPSKANIPTKNNLTTETEKKADNAGADKGILGRRRIVVNRAASNRVVLPRKQQQPLVIIENEEADEEDLPPEKVAREESSLKAIVNGLPPGMTEARLLSLCGPEVEQVSIDGGTAEALFSTGDACARFVRRFNGKMVSAHCLQVRRA